MRHSLVRDASAFLYGFNWIQWMTAWILEIKVSSVAAENEIWRKEN